MFNNSVKAFDHPTLYFGKLPNFADFIRYNASGDTIRTFDQWIQEGLYMAKNHYNRDWDSIYKTTPMYNFLFNPENAENLLVGVYMPSYDKSERKYPFIISKRLDKKLFDTSFTHLIPMIYSQFFLQSLQLLNKKIENLSLDEITKSVDDLHNINTKDFEISSESYEDFVTGTMLENLLARLFGSFDDQKRILFFENLLNILYPIKLQKPSQLSFGIRFLLSNNSFSMAKEVCFWIHLCMQILGDVHVIPNIFWQIPANNRYNFLFLNFRKPTSKTFLQLMQPELYMDTIFRLEEEGKDSIIYAAQNILPEVRLALENTNLTLCEFIEKF